MSFWTLAEENPTRSLVFYAAGAIIGLALAGYGLFTAKGSSVGGVPAEAVALVNQRPILRSDFIAQTENETGAAFAEATPQQRRKVLTDMVNEELQVQRGLDIDLAAYDPDVRSALVAGVNLQVNADILARQPTDAELRAYYQAHRDKYRAIGVFRIRDLVAPLGAGQSAEAVQAQAAQAAAALRKGQNIETVIAQFGLKEFGAIDSGENFDFAVKAKLGNALYAAADRLRKGQVSDPVAQTDGAHILVVLDRKTPPPIDFASARDAVWQDEQRDARARVEAANIAYLRSKAEIRLAPDYHP